MTFHPDMTSLPYLEPSALIVLAALVLAAAFATLCNR